MSGNGEEPRLQLPPEVDFLVRRDKEHGGDIVVRCHSLGLGRADALICYLMAIDRDLNTGDPIVTQRVVRIFRHFNDVEEVDIPTNATRH